MDLNPQLMVPSVAPSIRRWLKSKCLKSSGWWVLVLGVVQFGQFEACAAIGDLDQTFGHHGAVMTGLGTSYDAAYCVAMQPDGKIVVAGDASTPGRDYGITTYIAVARYNADGSIDASFGDGGIVHTSLGTRDDHARSVAIQDDGKILVCGYALNRFALVRYNVDGSLDATFGMGGKVLTFVPSGVIHVNCMALLPDGKVLLGGVRKDGGNRMDLALARYTPQGILDPTFGNGGLVFTDVAASQDSCNSIAISNEGKIVLAGVSYISGSYWDYLIARYNPDGSLDEAFGDGGTVRGDFASDDDSAYSVVVQNDGKMVVAGSARVSGASCFSLIRHNVDGSVDASFGNQGKVVTPVGFQSAVQQLAWQLDGKLVAGGWTWNGTNFDFAATRYHPTGELDTTFGIAGIGRTPIGADNDVLLSLTPAGDGKLVMAGYADVRTTTDFALARYDSNGMLDESFAILGKGITETGASDDVVQRVAIQGDGKILAAGYSRVGGNYDYLLVRYNREGTLDRSFGSGGKVLTELESDDRARSVVVQEDGRIILGGISSRGGSDAVFVLARYNSDGTRDGQFGNDGLVEAPPLGAFDTAITLLQEDNKILLAGESDAGAGLDFTLLRFSTNGSLDPTFGAGGLVTVDIATEWDSVEDAVLQSDGRILVLGSTFDWDTFTWVPVLVRFTTDGHLDSTLGSGGLLFPGGLLATSVAVQGDGRILLCRDATLTRYNADGTPDAGFGNGGVANFEMGSGERLFLQPDGRIVVGGTYYNGLDLDIVISRYNADGILDSSFGEGGIVVIEGAGSNESTRDLVGQADGNIIVAGTYDDGTDLDFLVLRFLGSNQAPVGIRLTHTSVLEQQSVGALVGELETMDPDLPNDRHTYSLVNEAVYDGNRYFTIQSNRLLTASQFVYSQRSAYQIAVAAHDSENQAVTNCFYVYVMPDSTTKILRTHAGTVEDQPLDLLLAVDDPAEVTADLFRITHGPENGTLDVAAGQDFANSVVTYTPATNYFGLDGFTYVVKSVDRALRRISVTIQVTPVNDAPRFVLRRTSIQIDNADPRSRHDLLVVKPASVSKGAPNESSQRLQYVVTASNPSLFTSTPSMSPQGRLRFSSPPHAHGSSTLTIQLKDDGGTARGGVDTSTIQTLTLTLDGL
jgi:uncharacterized delta-60 repeat protein